VIESWADASREGISRTAVSLPAYPMCIITTALSLALMVGGCTRPEPSGPTESVTERPNILLITVDTLRPDYLSIYGYQEHTTPNIDELGNQGVVFDKAYCNVTWTTPSMATTLTGLLPTQHGFRSTFDRLPDDIETVAERLGQQGYRNIAVIGSYPLDSIYGLDQGFDVYDDDFTVPLVLSDAEDFEDLPSQRGRTIQEQEDFNKKKAFGKSRRTDAEVSDTAIGYLAEIDETRPFFLWVHYFGPHSLPDTRKHGLRNLRNHVDTYPDKVVRSDREVGRLLDQLKSSGLDANTLVIFHSDHGEALGEHKYIGHGRYLFADNLKIPLIIRWPGVTQAGRRVDAIVGTIDIATTILEAAGVPTGNSPLQGRSVLPALLDGTPIRNTLYLETYMPAHRGFAEKAELSNGEKINVGVCRFGILRYPYKLVVTQPHQLFDDPDNSVSDELASRFRGLKLFNVEDDPGEEHDLSDQEPEILHELETLLERYLQESSTSNTPSADLSDEQIEKLRSLGYLQ